MMECGKFYQFVNNFTYLRCWRSAIGNRISSVGNLFARQCEFVAVQRIRRTFQILALYNRLYSERSLKQMAAKLARKFGKTKSKPLGFLFSATMFCWKSEMITDEDIARCAKDLDHAVELGRNIQNVKADSNKNTKGMVETEKWELVVEKPDMKIWRKIIPGSSVYEYKVYGSFYDIPAWAFYTVQVDLSYRKRWDKLVIALDVVDKDEESNCEVVHWVMHYPFPMYSRDYVYIRRHLVDHDNNVMVLVSKATDHPSCPTIGSQFVRVTQYSSCMVIKPHVDFSQNGFDYVLTYSDDPQAIIPSPAYYWMASSGLPEFVNKLHTAAMALNKENAVLPEKVNQRHLQSGTEENDRVANQSSNGRIYA